MNTVIRRFTSKGQGLTLNHLKSEPLLDFVVSSDFYRIDVGLIICRRPIFLHLEDPEIESIKRTHQLKVKYDLYSPFPKEFGQFDRENIEKPNQTFDDRVTHIKRHQDGSVTQFRPHSKYWRFAQPEVYDPHRVQTHGVFNVFYLVKQDGKWAFPQMPATHKATLNRTKEELFKKLANEQFKVMYTSKYPMCVQRSSIPAEELETNEFLRKCLGRKIFYFPALHDEGSTTAVAGFEDFAWVPKPLLNKYLGREDFEAVVPHLREFTH
jgi:hypothetical protein